MSIPLQVAFLTGQSDPRSCALSPVQNAFLDALPLSETAKVRANFPYTPHSPRQRDMPLWRASWNNLRQYLASRSPSFAARHQMTVTRMIDRAEHTIFLAGSSGLELLANLQLSESVLERVYVFAYGTVARRRPACEILAVCGAGDWIARRWRERGDILVGGGHLSYLERPEVLALCTRFITGVCEETGALV